MNFLLRSSATAAADHPPATPPRPTESSKVLKPVTTLEGLIGEDKFPSDFLADDRDGVGSENGSMTPSPSSARSTYVSTVDKHVDVMDGEGWIIIPFKELPDDWNTAPDLHRFRSLDRPFVFAGEQVHILACLSASKQDTEIITPFKVAAIMNKNGVGQSARDQNGDVLDEDKSLSETGQKKPGHGGENSESDPQKDVSASESILRLEDHRRQTQTLLQRFKDSHFFVRIAEAGEPLWFNGSAEASETVTAVSVADDAENENKVQPANSINAIIDRGSIDARVSGGAARNSVKCCSLPNGDIVVLLQVNIGNDTFKDPMLEILQFEKYRDRIAASENEDESVNGESDSYGDLLKWLLPLDNTYRQIGRPMSPPLANASHKSSFSASTGSQLFSFGHLRSYSMSSLPQNIAPAPAQPLPSASSDPSFDVEDWDRLASQKFVRSQKPGTEGLLSFRGVQLEPERFSVRCGLEGIYVPGRRWRRRLEIVQPVEIHTFAAECNTDDLLCVQVKNVSPAHHPDIVVYIDAINIILEEASKCDPPCSVPMVCIEAGTEYSLPNLSLRRGEEHSFVLKPATSITPNSKLHGDRVPQSSRSKPGSRSASMRLPPKAVEPKRKLSTSDKYAVLVSCRCNYTESRLFFKKPTDWRPRISRDIMVSVASEMSRQKLDHDGRVSQLPVQVLTLQASNLTSQDLTMTILAPASFTSPPSVVSLNSPLSPVSPLLAFSTTQSLSTVPRVVENPRHNTQSLSFGEHAVPIADVIPTTSLGCTHLWLHSRVPLGSVPSQSAATIKLELLPLTDGIITLDTLQIHVKEKGLTYIPEHPLKINATSSITTGIA